MISEEQSKLKLEEHCLLEAKRILYLLLLQKPRERLTHSEVDQMFALCHDIQIQEFLEARMVEHRSNSEWIPVSSPPLDGVEVETKIVSDNLGDWCLVRRILTGGKWTITSDGISKKVTLPPPTHWHA